jgi:uncharacterized Zn finger protein
MRFGTCPNCNKYKYLGDTKHCPSCTDDSQCPKCGSSTTKNSKVVAKSKKTGKKKDITIVECTNCGFSRMDY